jgi:hypothetical protein
MIQYITGIPSNQIGFSSLEDTILPENPPNNFTITP